MLQLLALPLSNENGLARTPPLGWRSWNLYGANVNQSLIEGIMDGMMRKDRTVDGVPTSLCDLGYCDVGLDDNWQACGTYIIIALIPVPPPQPIATATSTEIAVVNILRNRIISRLSASAHI